MNSDGGLNHWGNMDEIRNSKEKNEPTKDEYQAASENDNVDGMMNFHDDSQRMCIQLLLLFLFLYNVFATLTSLMFSI